MELNILLPGAMALASPPTAPYILGTPGLILKSSISSFRKKPAPPTTVLLPYELFNVVVIETAFPSLSITLKCVVSSLSIRVTIPGLITVLGVALSGL